MPFCAPRFLKFCAAEAFEILKFLAVRAFLNLKAAAVNLRQTYELPLAIFENGDPLVAELARFGVNFIVI